MHVNKVFIKVPHIATCVELQSTWMNNDSTIRDVNNYFVHILSYDRLITSYS